MVEAGSAIRHSDHDAPVVVFANPFSGHRDNRARVAGLEAALAARRVPCRVVWSPTEWGGALAGPVRALVAAGGDGSVNAAVNALGRSSRPDTPFATLPVGTENLFAAALGFDRPVADLADALSRAADAGGTRPLDVGEVSRPPMCGSGTRAAAADPPHRFVLMLSRGFDAAVVARMDAWRRAAANPGAAPAVSPNPAAPGGLRRVNRWSYAPRIAATLLRYGHPAVRLVTDAGESVTGARAYVFNLDRYGGGFPLGAGAAGDDGQMDWLVFRRPGRLRTLRDHWLAARHRHRDADHVAWGRASSLRLEAVDRPVPTQADGDPLPGSLDRADGLSLRVRPGALRVVDTGPATDPAAGSKAARPVSAS